MLDGEIDWKLLEESPPTIADHRECVDEGEAHPFASTGVTCKSVAVNRSGPTPNDYGPVAASARDAVRRHAALVGDW